MRTDQNLTTDVPSAEVIEPSKPEEPAAPSLKEFWTSRGLPTRQHRESLRAAVCPPPKPPERPVPPSAPQPTVGPASAAFDGAWAKLMASVKPDVPRSNLLTPVEPVTGNGNSQNFHICPNATRPEVGPPRGAEIPELVRALEGSGPQAVVDLVAALGDRWKDRKPETLAFWTSALAEVGAGLLSVDLVAALVKDADRPTVKHKARQFSQALGQELAAARQAQKNRLPGGRQTAPAGGQKASPQTSTHFTMNGSSRK